MRPIGLLVLLGFALTAGPLGLEPGDTEYTRQAVSGGMDAVRGAGFDDRGDLPAGVPPVLPEVSGPMPPQNAGPSAAPSVAQVSHPFAPDLQAGRVGQDESRTGITKMAKPELPDVPDGVRDAVARRAIDADENELAAPVFFASSRPDAGILQKPPTERFAPQTGRIFAAFDASTLKFAQRQQVLARWHDASGALLTVMPVAVEEGAVLGVSTLAQAAWAPGLHNVEIFGADDGLPLLASGSFEVSTAPDLIELQLTLSEQGNSPRELFLRQDPVVLRVRYATPVGRTIEVGVFAAGGRIPVRATAIHLPPATAGAVAQTLKYAGEPLPAGRYLVEVHERNQFVAGLAFIQQE